MYQSINDQAIFPAHLNKVYLHQLAVLFSDSVFEDNLGHVEAWMKRGYDNKGLLLELENSHVNCTHREKAMQQSRFFSIRVDAFLNIYIQKGYWTYRTAEGAIAKKERKMGEMKCLLLYLLNRLKEEYASSYYNIQQQQYLKNSYWKNVLSTHRTDVAFLSIKTQNQKATELYGLYAFY